MLLHPISVSINGWSYDAAGTLTSDGTNTYTYDVLTRLISTEDRSYT